jgi:D-3-phosphoglycerate dehydrogenase
MKILITPRSFASNDDTPIHLLRKHGVELILNTTGGIMSLGQMKEGIAGCDGVIVGVDPLDASVLSMAPKLKAVSKYGVGVDNIDMEYCERRGITVTRTVGANSEAVADYAFALMLGLARKVLLIDRACRKGDWSKITTLDVSRKHLGLIGLGAVGRQMAGRAAGFNMRVTAYDILWDEDYAGRNSIHRADVDTICRECDFISLHLPLNDDTKHIVDARRIGLMKPTAFLINTARGGLIDEKALEEALAENRIAGAGLDAFVHEPPENPSWFSLQNVIIGSHCAASTVGASDRMSLMAARNLLLSLKIITE